MPVSPGRGARILGVWAIISGLSVAATLLFLHVRSLYVDPVLRELSRDGPYALFVASLRADRVDAIVVSELKEGDTQYRTTDEIRDPSAIAVWMRQLGKADSAEPTSWNVGHYVPLIPRHTVGLKMRDTGIGHSGSTYVLWCDGEYVFAENPGPAGGHLTMHNVGFVELVRQATGASGEKPQ